MNVDQRISNHLRRLKRRLRYVEIKDNQLSSARLVVFLLFLSTLVVGAFFRDYGIWVALLCSVELIAFFWLIRVHNKVAGHHKQLQRLHEVYVDLQARLHLNWPEIASHQPIELSHKHLFANDLGLFGDKSLFHLLDVTTTDLGADLLRRRMLKPSLDVETIRRFQKAGSRDRGSFWFWARFRMLGSFSVSGNGRLKLSHIARWLGESSEAAALRSDFFILLGLLLLALLGVMTEGIWRWLFLAYPIYFIFFFLRISKHAGTLFKVDEAHEHLKNSKPFLDFLERASRQTQRDVLACFRDQSTRPSRFLRRIARALVLLSISNSNPVSFLLLNAVFPWDFLMRWILEHLRNGLQKPFLEWMNVIAELDYEHVLAVRAGLDPQACLPEFVPEFVFSFTDIGHPLISDSEKVRNSFHAEKPGELVLISGSNMSGKSTFLRTLGINVLLARMGAVVDARSAKLCPMRIGCSIQVSDSLAEGVSYFYAEVRRLKTLLDLSNAENEVPMLVLIDEIFRGTNNKERFVGSKAVVSALVGRKALSFVSTHDLDLVKLAENMGDVRNMHFRDYIQEETMFFDYKIHSGPSPTTNAVFIMRKEGLPV